MIPLKKLRDREKITQAELGKKLDIAPSTVSMWEKGCRAPDYEMLKRIAKFFNVSTDYLLDNEVKHAEKFSDDETNLIHDYRLLDEDGKNLVVSVARRLRGTIGKSNYSVHNNGSNFGMVGGNFNAKVTIG